VLEVVEEYIHWTSVYHLILCTQCVLEVVKEYIHWTSVYHLILCTQCVLEVVKEYIHWTSVYHLILCTQCVLEVVKDYIHWTSAYPLILCTHPDGQIFRERLVQTLCRAAEFQGVRQTQRPQQKPQHLAAEFVPLLTLHSNHVAQDLHQARAVRQ
jgi:uncharacterized protein YxjI